MLPIRFAFAKNFFELNNFLKALKGTKKNFYEEFGYVVRTDNKFKFHNNNWTPKKIWEKLQKDILSKISLIN